MRGVPITELAYGKHFFFSPAQVLFIACHPVRIGQIKYSPDAFSALAEQSPSYEFTLKRWLFDQGVTRAKDRIVHFSPDRVVRDGFFNRQLFSPHQKNPWMGGQFFQRRQRYLLSICPD
jgi:hypothetical protein